MKRARIIVIVTAFLGLGVCPVQAIQYTITDLGTLGGQESWAYGINDGGQVAGYAYLAGNSGYHAFLYSGGVMQDLGALGGSGNYSIARAINDSGKVAGFAYLSVDVYHAFLYSGSGLQDLGTLGGSWSDAFGINDSGRVVGRSFLAGDTEEEHAFVYADGVMTDLNTLLPAGSSWTLTEARAVNDAGQIAGFGTNPDGLTRGFLLIPCIPGDANGDKQVNLVDLSILATHYGQSNLTGNTWALGDFNDDQAVGLADLSILAGHYGEGSDTAPDF